MRLVRRGGPSWKAFGPKSKMELPPRSRVCRTAKELKVSEGRAEIPFFRRIKISSDCSRPRQLSAETSVISLSRKKYCYPFFWNSLNINWYAIHIISSWDMIKPKPFQIFGALLCNGLITLVWVSSRIGFRIKTRLWQWKPFFCAMSQFALNNVWRYTDIVTSHFPPLMACVVLDLYQLSTITNINYDELIHRTEKRFSLS